MLRFILIFIFTYGIASCLFLFWFWRALSLKPLIRWILFPPILVFAACFHLFYRPVSDLSSPIFLPLLQIGGLWLGAFLYTFFLAICIEIVCFKKTEKVRLWRYRAYLTLSAVIFLIAGIGAWTAASPVIEELDITLHSKTIAKDKTITLAAISDVHLGRLISTNFLEKSLQKLKPYQPDALLFVGDILDDHEVNTQKVKASLEALQAPLGVFAVLGNHEYISGIEGSLDILEKSGFTLLRDDFAPLGEDFLLVGRDDFSRPRFEGSSRQYLPRILASVPEDQKKRALIVLDHQPQVLEDAEKENALLQISGHTHNGQLWPVNFIINRLYQNPTGHLLRGQTHSVVMKGLGTWGPPMRTSGRPDMWVIRIHVKAQS